MTETSETETASAESPESTNPSEVDREIEELQRQIFELNGRLHAAWAKKPSLPVPDYRFETLEGEVSLASMFGSHDDLLMIHNMGQACRYCTLWGDSLDGVVAHLESTVALAMVSKDPPEIQRSFARSRGWRIRMVSHGGGEYMHEQVAMGGAANMPGVTHYQRQNGVILRRASSFFGPGDPFCPVWHFLALAGINESGWTPQYDYWQRPRIMEDGGENLPASV